MQDFGTRLKEYPTIIREAPFSWFNEAPPNVKTLLKELAAEVGRLEEESKQEEINRVRDLQTLGEGIRNAFFQVRMRLSLSW